ncbi:aldehyde dehydrogenase family protein [Subtercola endophyticus]|uniref:aldehyde dehydrogenase family protein n=1 Tax=Subtercola endophyticus TaxID=2895559 RepID=UPI001E501DFD|nr:aldehyde dehydrogenase family protein [Subtercola endophyticus]UFS58762.1 aldehyde dehydrogenase family protein [Subtercola endophyticus]
MSIAVDHIEAKTSLPEPGQLIGGEWVTTTTGESLRRVDPSTNELLLEFPAAGQKEVDDAVRAARLAFPAWKRTPVNERRGILLTIARLLSESDEQMKTIVALETGSPRSVFSVAPAVDWWEYYAGWADKFAGELNHGYPGRSLSYTRYEPYGVIGALIPWNGPLNVAAMKLAPALAAGNCVVLKTPELSPFAVMRLAQICAEAGLPAGVLGVLNGGRSVSKAIIDHPDVKKVSFTGGPSTGTQIMARAAETLTPVVMELGGKSANLIFADADLDSATLMSTMMGAVLGAGQGCLFPTRLLVQDTVYDDVIARVQAIAENAPLGDPLDLTKVMGPVIGEVAFDRIMDYIEIARNDGSSRLVTGGKRVGGDLQNGFFIEPTIFADVDNSSRIAQEEIFGPVLSVIKFHDEAEAVSIANDSTFGLGAYLHTQDVARAHRVADDLDAGWVGINSFPPLNPTSPFGGVKSSGFGREGGRAGIEEYVHHKSISVPID